MAFKEAITLVWDLMDTPDGIKILEMQPFYGSRFSGHFLGHRDFSRYVQLAHMNKFRDSRSIENLSDDPFIRAVSLGKSLNEIFLGAASAGLYPKQKTYAAGKDPELITTILDDFSGVDSIVLKQNSGCRAEGVYVIHRDELSQSMIDRMYYLHNQEDLLSLFTVQEAVKPSPIAVTKWWKKPYVLPVTRIVASINPEPDGKLTWLFHGGYNKCPPSRFWTKKGAETAVFKEKDREKIVSDIKQGGGQPLPDKRFEDICQQLETGLTPVFSKIAQYGSTPFVKEALQSSDHAHALGALEYISIWERKASPYNNFCSRTDLPESDININLLLNDQPEICALARDALRAYPEFQFGLF